MTARINLVTRLFKVVIMLKSVVTVVVKVMTGAKAYGD